MLMRIVCERNPADPAHWSAWFADSPATAFGGDWPGVAIERLVAYRPDLSIHIESLTTDHARSCEGHLEFVGSSSDEKCPECRGTGRYIGLNVSETCRTCQGGSEQCDGVSDPRSCSSCSRGGSAEELL